MEEQYTFEEDYHKHIGKYTKRGRCAVWHSEKVGTNSVCVDYDDGDHFYCKIVGKKRQEFSTALEHCVGSCNKEDFEPIEASEIGKVLLMGGNDPDDKIERCFCTMTIKVRCFIRYVPDGRILMIGSRCIRSFFGKDFYKLIKGKKCKTVFCESRMTSIKFTEQQGYCLDCVPVPAPAPISYLKRRILHIDKIQMSNNINEETPIGFGKLKGKPHAVLLRKENQHYKKWIIDQGPEFRYYKTREWILQEERESCYSKSDIFKIISNTDEEHTLRVFQEIQEILNREENKGHFVHPLL